MKQCHFVFDIDDTITLHISQKTWRDDIKDMVAEFGEEFALKHVIWAAEFPHYIFPGMPELWRWLDSLGHRFSMCSSGLAVRNDEFADNFLKLAFGDAEKVKSVRDNMRVMSRGHLVKASDDDLLEKYFCPKGIFGNYKKVLHDVFCTIDELPYTFLIDDDRSYVARGELQNFLAVHTGYGLQFRDDYKSSSAYTYLFKAFMLAGLLQTMFEMLEERSGWTPVEVAKKLQFDDCKDERSKEYVFQKVNKFDAYQDGDSWSTKHRDSPRFATQEDPRLFLKGEKILQQLNPQLHLPEGFTDVVKELDCGKEAKS